MNLLYERLLLLALVFVLCIVIWCMYDNWYVYSHAADGRKLMLYKPGIAGAVSPEDSPISDDMAAWLTIDGTGIDYPVMQSSDNIRYLNTDPFGSYSLSGSIFLDCRNAADFTDPYSLVYGHHMEHGRMFGALDDFLSEAYLKQHSKGTLMIGKKAEKTYSLEVFAAMRANAANKTIFNLSDPDALRTELKTRATVYTEDKDARILGLSTCAEGDAVSRILVFCYLTES